MPEEKNINLMKYWPLMVGILMIAGTWASIKSHMSNDDIHLTEEQRNNLVEFRTIVNDKIPNIKENHEDIEQLKTDFAVFDTKFDFLYNEVEGLESKSSRNYVELRNKIDE